MDYNFRTIEKKWQKYWSDNRTFEVKNDSPKPKYYVLDMFPYPSGAGLHVGHPLGYIASDIYTRFKRLQGYNVLHPMGYDAFGLPAEQFAIQTGQHPAVTTEKNIQRYREQLQIIGLSYDWSRELRTCDPAYFHWTQWAFIKMFKSWYNNRTQKAEPIDSLIGLIETSGNATIEAACSDKTPLISATDWAAMSEEARSGFLMNYRIAYLAEAMVNWCAELGTVLANDEVKDGLSVRGGHPVEQIKMKQWQLRVTAYAQRLLEGLDTIDWTDSLKEMQRNWIGRSEGAQLFFDVKGQSTKIEIFTTRPDTIYGATFMVLAPESEYAAKLTTPACKAEVEQYLEYTRKRTERDRIAETKVVTGVFSGSYAVNPFTGNEIPVWISEYVLAGYGTGAIMAVPAHDSRDFAFARHFGLPIVQVVCQPGQLPSDPSGWETSFDAKEGKMINSDIINNLEVKAAIESINTEIERRGIGKRRVNFRLRDAIFSRQRYWGEPFPVYYKDGIPQVLDENSQLPLELPEIDKYQPTEQGEPPLGRAKNWKTPEGWPYELSTMPGFAGSSAYYLRYMDPANTSALVSKEANDYWQDVDLYIGGAEHATGHLIYSRFWNKFLFDLGYVCKDEPFRKLINQGMIQGRSNFVYRVNTRKYAEARMWEMLNSKFEGYKFKRDYKVNDEYFTFCCEEKNLLIEIANSKSAQAFLDDHQADAQAAGYRLMVVSPDAIIEDNALVFKKIAFALDNNECDCLISGDYPAGPVFVSLNLLRDEYQYTPIHTDVNIVQNDVLDIDTFRKWRLEYEQARFVLEDGKYHCGWAVEKMSKTMYNVVNPDDIIDKYGADTLRLYEMFLGPIEQAKPWDTNGIEGTHKFLRKLWKLYHDSANQFTVSDEQPSADELRVLHKAVKKVEDDILRFSFNTSVSTFMICVNDLAELRCNKRAILEPLAVLVSPFAPHIAEELWQLLGHSGSVAFAAFPVFDESLARDNSVVYPVSFNGKRRYEVEAPADADPASIEKLALTHEKAEKWMEGKQLAKVIVVPGKIVNVVLK